MALTQAQKTQTQTLRDDLTGPLYIKYGAAMELQGFELPVDGDGDVTALLVNIVFNGPADPDGFIPRIRKQIDLW